MYKYCDEKRLATLAALGGAMYFLIERKDFIYRGMVVLSPVKDAQRTRVVCIKRYRYKEVENETRNTQDTSQGEKAA